MTFHEPRHICPFRFFPNVKPRNLKVRIANTLTTRLFSWFTFNFSGPSRYFVLVSSSLLATLSLFASKDDVVRVTDKYNSTLLILLVKLIQIDVCQQGERFPPCGEPSSVSMTTPFSITPLFKYLLIHWITLSSLTFLRRIFRSISWFRVSKYFDKSMLPHGYIPCSAYSFTF